MSITDPTKHPYTQTIVAHYQKEMSLEQVNAFSKSPTKPGRFMRFLLEQTPIGTVAAIPQRTISHYLPSKKDLEIAHEPGYVKAFTEGRDIVASDIDGAFTYSRAGSGLPWSPELVQQVLYNTASLTSATYGAIANPGEIHFSPSSGFHHAGPQGGEGFCSISGQVIAAVKAWRTHQKRCAWIDLDGHFGNSLPDTVEHCPDILQAVKANVNPAGRHRDYIMSLNSGLDMIEDFVRNGTVDYVCVALGADSHEWDAIGGGQCSTDEWIAAADLVFSRLRSWSIELGRPVPVVLSLFGGYRDDHPDSVLSLHAAGLARALHWLSGAPLDLYKADVKEPVR